VEYVSRLMAGSIWMLMAIATSAEVILNEPSVNSGDQQGFVVALSADGIHALVGAPGATVNGTNQAGKAFMYVLSHGQWQRTQEFDDPTPVSGDRFGSALAMSSDGSTLIIGAPGASAGGQDAAGRVFVFTSAAGSWSLHELSEPEAAASDAFGTAVAISGNGGIAVVGAPAAARSGKAFVFTLNAGVAGGTTAELDAPAEAGGNYHFGNAVAIAANGNDIVVGAPVIGDGVPAGKAWLFVTGKSNAAQARVSSLFNAFKNNTSLLQAAKGGNSGPWSVGHEFDNPVSDKPGYFGSSLAISADGSEVLIGAYGEYSSTDNSNQGDGIGAAYLYTQASGWGTPQVFMDAAAVRLEGFGNSVSLASDGKTLAIGAQNAGVNSADAAGKVFVYQLSSGTWTPSHTFGDPRPADGNNFGSAVALSSEGATLLVGAMNVAVTGRGSAGLTYVFPPVIELAVSIGATPEQALVGSQFTYHINVRNTDRRVTATHVQLSDTLPSVASLVSFTPATCVSQAQTISCDLGSLAPGISSTITITVIAPQQPGAIADRAAAKADQTDPHSPYNRASLIIDVIPPPKPGT
jgi:uncharacterized repeat protein (TIGR01451 family)